MAGGIEPRQTGGWIVCIRCSFNRSLLSPFVSIAKAQAGTGKLFCVGRSRLSSRDSGPAADASQIARDFLTPGLQLSRAFAAKLTRVSRLASTDPPDLTGKLRRQSVSRRLYEPSPALAPQIRFPSLCLATASFAQTATGLDIGGASRGKTSCWPRRPLRRDRKNSESSAQPCGLIFSVPFGQ